MIGPSIPPSVATSGVAAFLPRREPFSRIIASQTSFCRNHKEESHKHIVDQIMQRQRTIRGLSRRFVMSVTNKEVVDQREVNEMMIAFRMGIGPNQSDQSASNQQQ